MVVGSEPEMWAFEAALFSAGEVDNARRVRRNS